MIISRIKLKNHHIFYATCNETSKYFVSSFNLENLLTLCKLNISYTNEIADVYSMSSIHKEKLFMYNTEKETAETIMNKYPEFFMQGYSMYWNIVCKNNYYYAIHPTAKNYLYSTDLIEILKECKLSRNRMKDMHAGFIHYYYRIKDYPFLFKYNDRKSIETIIKEYPELFI